ncbi:iron ABC transporter permease [Candidatus Micrarchaeota archaeon]|nr:iron ABC transporter permease [Candidatus Micrarchaeota archaeon]
MIWKQIATIIGLIIAAIIANALGLLNLVLNNIFQASISALASVILGFPLSYALIGKGIIARALRAFSLVPLVLPQPLMILSLVLLFGANGNFSLPFSLFSLGGIIFAHTLYNFPLAARIIAQNLGKSIEFEKTGKSLGANSLKSFLQITLPSLRGAIISAFTVAFAFSFTSFTIPLVFGGISNTTLEVEIFRSFFRNFEFERGIALAILQILIFLPVAFGLKKIPWRIGKEQQMGKFGSLVAIPYLLIFATIFFYPYSKIGMGNFSVGPIINSFLLAAASSAICMLLWLAISRREGNLPLLLLGISPAVLAVGFFYLPYSFYLLAIGHAILALPLVGIVLSSQIESIIKLKKTAKSLGANRWKAFWEIEIPILKAPLGLAFAFSFMFSIGETAFVSSLSQGLETISTSLVTSFSAYRFSRGYSYSLILMFLSLAFSAMLEGLNVFGLQNKKIVP